MLDLQPNNEILLELGGIIKSR